MEELIIQLFDQYPVLSTILAVALAAHSLASAITALTPTPKDDGVVKTAYGVIEWIALVVGKAKDTGDKNE